MTTHSNLSCQCQPHAFTSENVCWLCIKEIYEYFVIKMVVRETVHVHSKDPDYSWIWNNSGYEWPGFISRKRQWWDFFLRLRIQTTSEAHPASYPIGTGGAKQPGREADHSPPSIVEVNAWSYTSTPQYVVMTFCLVKKERAGISQWYSAGLRAGYDWGFESRRGLGIFLFTTASRPALGPTQPAIQWVPAALSLTVKQPGREANYTPSWSAEVKECVESYLHSQYAFMAWCSVKKKVQGQLYHI
jgi:hypothetical protein